MSRASSDGKVRSGTSTGRCKSPALLVLTLRGRLLRVAFGLLSDARSQTLVTLLYVSTRREFTKQSRWFADQLNSSPGCLLCGAGRTSVAQPSPPEQPESVDLDCYQLSGGGNSLDGESSLRSGLSKAQRIRMLTYPVIAAGNRTSRRHEPTWSKACSREAQPRYMSR